jgi:superfamily I DNA and RNA helicase
MEIEVANLDKWQQQAAIETPAGPQRVRGLAGTGKTIVLALKAAYLHSKFPEWTIAVTFYSRTLYQQFQDLIRRFAFDTMGHEPDWTKVRVRHSWGSSQQEGIYSQIANYCGVEPRDFLSARQEYGMSNAFDGVCRELLMHVSQGDFPPIYDVVLIDEAQDFPPSFLQLVHRFTKDPQRVVWAYDEMQKISEIEMPNLTETFGVDPSGAPRVTLDTPGQDIVLPVCYRNPPWTLTAAHALGLGIYRQKGLVQHFDDPTLWRDIGYRLIQGDLSPGTAVTLERATQAAPTYFRDLLEPSDVVWCQSFANPQEQAEWVAEEIKNNIQADQLDIDDILIVLPNALSAKTISHPISRALAARGIPSRLVGVTSSRDEIFAPGVISMAHIHRSKGNEAPMVYVVDAQTCLEGPGLITLRNTLFTAITRSKAWVRITGWGPSMTALRNELDKVKSNDYRLQFRIPTSEELEQMRRLNRDLTAEERAALGKAQTLAVDLVATLEKGEIEIEHLPLEVRRRLREIFSSNEGEDGDAP